MKMASVIRTTTPLTPVMDDAYVDVYFFFVPNRLVWDNWQEFLGENKETPWAQTQTFTVPQLTAQSGSTGVQRGTSLDYFGIPLGYGAGGTDSGQGITAMIGRMYGLIFNEFFRDQNYQFPVHINKSSTNDVIYDNLSADPSDYVRWGTLGMLLPVNRYHDYFSTILPDTQKGQQLGLSLGQIEPSWLPIYTRWNGTSANDALPISVPFRGSPVPLGGAPLTSPTEWNNLGMSFRQTLGAVFQNNNPNIQVPLNIGRTQNTLTPFLPGNSQSVADTQAGVAYVTNASNQAVHPSNLWAQFGGGSIDPVLINDLRIAFQVQRLLERDARGGTRYNEIIHSHFGVIAPDFRLQRPEFLGGKKINVNSQQVEQTAPTGPAGALGDTGAFSLTGQHDHIFDKSFVEHGYIIGLAAARTRRTYQQGIERMWFRKDKLDFYYPVLAHIGEQPVLQGEIFATGKQDDTDISLGAQEAWADYRYKPNRISGEFRSTAAQPLDMWHYGDIYATPPVISDEWLREDKSRVDRTLAVSSSLVDQLKADIYFDLTCTRPMPIYSVPGMIDHF